MPEISRFYGIIICLMFKDIGKHNKAHLHVRYCEFSAVISLDCELLAGRIPEKQFTLVKAWILIHEDELLRAWDLAVNGKEFPKIEPLK